MLNKLEKKGKLYLNDYLLSSPDIFQIEKLDEFKKRQ